MSVDYRLDVADLLRQGLSDRAIMRELHCSAETVRRTRAALGLPARTVARTATRPEDLFRQRTKPLDDGHMEWTGSWEGDVPKIRVGGHHGRRMSAYRLAFLVHNGREPERPAVPVCGRERCVAPEHVGETPAGRPVDPARQEREQQLKADLDKARQELEQARIRYESARDSLRQFRREGTLNP